jgi:hypothetical protein
MQFEDLFTGTAGVSPALVRNWRFRLFAAETPAFPGSKHE